MFPTLDFGLFKISTFSFLVVMGVTILLLGFFLVVKFVKKVNFEETMLVTIFLSLSLIAGYLGGYLFDGLLKIEERGGLYFVSTAFYGGFLCAFGFFILLMFIFKKVHPKLDTLTYLNILTPFIVFAHALGRLGCFAAGCCFGKPTDSWAGVVFPSDAPASALYGPGTKVYATQIYEMASLLAILVLCLTLFKKRPFVAYLILYAIARFIIEFYRGDDRGASVLLSPSQWVAIFVFLGTCAYLIYTYFKKKKSPIADK